MNEATYTQPSHDCPHPEYYTAKDEQATENEVISLVAAFVNAVQPEVALETGTHEGLCAYAIGTVLHNNGHGRLHTFELNDERHAIARKSMSHLPVFCHKAHSLVNYWVPEGDIEFAWFDSEPHYRVREFNHYKQWFNHRTVVGFHDTGPQHGSWSAEVRGLPDLQWFELPTPRGVIFGRYTG